MSYSVDANQNFGEQWLTITGLIQLMSGKNPPNSISFPSLGNPAGATTSLGVGQGNVVTWGPNNAVTRSIGLISCASICFINTITGTAYVYHANTGHITNGGFNAIMGYIGAAGPVFNSVYITYTHPGNTDQGYQDSVTDMVNWGVPTNNIVEITNLFLQLFGLNNNLQLGY